MLIGIALYALFTCTPPVVTYAPFTGDIDSLNGGYSIADPFGNCYWIPGVINYGFSMSDMPDYFQSRALWQSRGVMQATAEINNVRLDDVAGGIALLFCSEVGNDAWVRVRSTDEWTHVRVADCANRIHAFHHITAAESGIELSYELAEQLGVLGYNEYGGIGAWNFEVCLDLSACTGTPVDLRIWFAENVRYN